VEVKFKPRALEDIRFLKQNGNAAIRRKITALLSELETHPETGTGKPEKLKEDLSGYWSRRINSEHRIIYTIDTVEQVVEVYSLRGHYENKK
jgi:toxin YoeB